MRWADAAASWWRPRPLELLTAAAAEPQPPAHAGQWQSCQLFWIKRPQMEEEAWCVACTAMKSTCSSPLWLHYYWGKIGFRWYVRLLPRHSLFSTLLDSSSSRRSVYVWGGGDEQGELWCCCCATSQTNTAEVLVFHSGIFYCFLKSTNFSHFELFHVFCCNHLLPSRVFFSVFIAPFAPTASLNAFGAFLTAKRVF